MTHIIKPKMIKGKMYAINSSLGIPTEIKSTFTGFIMRPANADIDGRHHPLIVAYQALEFLEVSTIKGGFVDHLVFNIKSYLKK